MGNGKELTPPKRKARLVVPLLVAGLAVPGCGATKEPQKYPTIYRVAEDGSHNFALEQRGPKKITIVGYDKDGLDSSELNLAAETLGEIGCDIDPEKPADVIYDNKSNSKNNRPNPAEVTVFSLTTSNCIADAVKQIKSNIPTA